MQERAGVRDIAEDVGEGIVDNLPPGASDFLERRQMAVLGTVDSSGRVWASVITGQPRFIETVDDHTLKITAPKPSSDPIFRKSHGRGTSGIVRTRLRQFAARSRKRLGMIKQGAIYLPRRKSTATAGATCRSGYSWASAPSAESAPAKRGNELAESEQQQIVRADTFFIATDNPERGADVSHKGGNPGFVKVIDERHIAFPDYNGNSMFNTLGNLTVNQHAGLLFIDFDSGRTLQLTGRASIDWSPARVHTFAGAERVVDFELDQVIDNPAGFSLLAKFRQYSRNNPKS